MCPLLISLIVFLVLIMTGVLVFGFGGAVVADNRLGAGVWAAGSIGMPNEGYVSLKKAEGFPTRGPDSSVGGVLDTSDQRGIAASTIMGADQNEFYGEKLPRF